MRIELETSPTSKHGVVFRFLFATSRSVFRFLFVPPPRSSYLPLRPMTTCTRTHTRAIASYSCRGYPPNPGGPRCASPRKQGLSCPQRCSLSSPSPVLLVDKQSPPSRQRSHLRDLPLHNPPTTPFC